MIERWLFIGFCLLVITVALLVWQYRMRKDDEAIPNKWIHIGVKPEGVDDYLKTLRPLFPRSFKWGGTIEWVDGPFLIRGNMRVWGVVINEYTHHVKVARRVPVQITALEHEIKHLAKLVPGD